MPLKHFTETFLVVLLGAVIAFTGLILSTLPPLPMGAIPWVILFVLTVIYPLGLTPLFQQRRADNAFRLLHWFPAVMALIWLLFQLVALYISPALGLGVISSFTWGWTLVGVVIGIVLLILFCLKVIRRRLPRVGLLLAILVLFIGGAIASESGPQWETELASVLWGNQWWQEFGTGGFLTASVELPSTGSGDKNLDPSEDPSEEAWREQLRMQQRREERIAERIKDRETSSKNGDTSSVAMLDDVSSDTMSSDDSSSSAGGWIAMENSKSSMLSGTGQEIRDAGTKPNQLPSSGFDLMTLTVLMLAGYATTIHSRAAKRVA